MDYYPSGNSQIELVEKEKILEKLTNQILRYLEDQNYES